MTMQSKGYWMRQKDALEEYVANPLYSLVEMLELDDDGYNQFDTIIRERLLPIAQELRDALDDQREHLDMLIDAAPVLAT